MGLYFIYKMSKTNVTTELIQIVEDTTDIEFTTSKNRSELKKNQILIHNNGIFEKTFENMEIGFAESYIDGDWDTNDLEYVIINLRKNQDKISSYLIKKSLNYAALEAKHFVSKIKANNTLRSSKKNIASHYDAGNDLYSKMLGKHMQYTCAYFNKPDMTLDEAQYAKMELIAKKLNLSPGMEVLDIGCGFGSMAHHLATKYNVEVTGVTLSKEQQTYSQFHFPNSKVNILLKDYRHLDRKYDRVYSVGMFEHVGRKNYKEYYDKCYDLLKDDGIMLIHSIGTQDRKWDSNAFINKYIFPEGELPHLSNLTEKFQDKWILEDFHNFGFSYAKTLRAWRKNIGNWEGLDNYDTKFRRMWDFYLYGCAAAFQLGTIHLWQLVYVKNLSNRKDNLHHIRN